MSDFTQDVTYSLRKLRSTPTFALAAIVTLALGIGATTAVFTVVNGVLLRPLPFADPGRLFLVSVQQPGFPSMFGPSMFDRDYLELRLRDRLFERTTSFSGRAVTLTRSGDPARLAAANVTADFFAVLRVNPALGRTFLPDDEEPGRDHVVVVGDKLWRDRLAADQRIAGKTVTLDGEGYTVIGVMPAGFAFPNDAQAWLPHAVRIDPHNSMMAPVVGRLRPGASRRQADEEIRSIFGTVSSAPGRDSGKTVTRLEPLNELLVGNVQRSLLVFAGAVTLVLLIACANVANLLLARALSRRQEIAVRAALGAGRGRLMRQLLTESTMVSLGGGALGLLLAMWGVRVLLALAPAHTIPRLEQIHVDWWVLAFTFGLSVLTGIGFGLAPALHATGRELRASLGQGARTVTPRHERLRGMLVVSEFALALVLLTGAGLLLQTYVRMRAVNPGFRPENVMTMTVDLPGAVYHTAAEMRQFHSATLARLSSVPGVIAAGSVNWKPLGGNLIRGTFQVEGKRLDGPGFMVDKPAVSPGYFPTMGMPLLRGRDFTVRDGPSAPGVVIVSRSVARLLWGDDDPIGRRVSLADHPKPEDWFTIVGVVDDVMQQGLRMQPDPAIYQPYAQVTRPFFLDHMTFAVRTAAKPSIVAPSLRRAVHDVDKDLPVQSLTAMNDVLTAATAEPLFQARLLATFSLLALALSAVGIYGVVACSVTERTHEIGIRIALGAEPGAVLRMVLRRTLTLAGAGLVLGAIGAVAATRVMARLLFEVRPGDPATILAVVMLLTTVALCAGLIPGRRAARVDPIRALRAE